MKEVVDSAIKDVKDVFPLTDNQEKFMRVLFELVFVKGERNQIINSMKSI